MINITGIGAAGKMGSRIIALSKDYKDIKLAGAVDRKEHKNIGQDIGDVIGIGKTGIKLVSNVKDVEGKTNVCIDFSSPESTYQNLKALSGNPVPVVIGTTGVTKNMTEEIKTYAQKVQCGFAQNMSFGV